MSDVLQIGRYQLENLLRQQIKFHFYDLSDDSPQAPPRHELTATALRLPAGDVLAHLRAQNAAGDAPIVLICENGSKSVALAAELEQNSFRNVYVVRGGIAAL